MLEWVNEGAQLEVRGTIIRTSPFTHVVFLLAGWPSWTRWPTFCCSWENCLFQEVLVSLSFIWMHAISSVLFTYLISIIISWHLHPSRWLTWIWRTLISLWFIRAYILNVKLDSSSYSNLYLQCLKGFIAWPNHFVVSFQQLFISAGPLL